MRLLPSIAPLCALVAWPAQAAPSVVGEVFDVNQGARVGTNSEGASCVAQFKDTSLYYRLHGDATAAMNSISAGHFRGRPFEPKLEHVGGGLGDVLGASPDKSALVLTYDRWTKRVVLIEEFWAGNRTAVCKFE